MYMLRVYDTERVLLRPEELARFRGEDIASELREQACVAHCQLHNGIMWSAAPMGRKRAISCAG